MDCTCARLTAYTFICAVLISLLATIPPEKSASELLKAHESRETTSPPDVMKVEGRASSGQLFAPDCRLGSDGQVKPCSGWNVSHMDKEVAVTLTGGQGKGASLEQPRNLPSEKTTSTYARSSIGDQQNVPDLGSKLPAVQANAASPGKAATTVA